MTVLTVRYLITTNHVTADEVREYSRDNTVSMSTAKRILENRTEPVLQYLPLYGEWKDVPTVTEYRNIPKLSEDKQ